MMNLGSADLAERVAARPRLLACGIAAGILFNIVVLAQAFTRPGYDLVRLPLSLLALGDWGWVQTLNFIAVGCLIIASALGVRRALCSGIGCLSGPILLALYGAGMALAGIFPADPMDNFPLGARQADTMTSHAQLHGVGFFVAHVAVIAACLVFAFRFGRLRSTGWAAYCAGTAVAVPLLIMLGFASEPVRGLAFFGTGLVAMGWLAAVTSKLGEASAR